MNKKKTKLNKREKLLAKIIKAINSGRWSDMQKYQTIWLNTIR